MKIATILLTILSLTTAAQAASTSPAPTPATTSTSQSTTTSPVPTPAATSTSQSPAPTPATTSTTTTPVSTPAATKINGPAPTPAATKPRSCWEVSVEHDATYCIDGPICSGSGAQPAGWNCPKKGDVAIADCWKYLASYADAGRCVAPVDAECRVIKTGAWGCVWKNSGSGSSVTPAPTVPKPTPAATTVPKPTSAATTMTPAVPNPTPAVTNSPTVPTPTPAKTTTKPSDGSSSSGTGSGSGSWSGIITITPPVNKTVTPAPTANQTIQFPTQTGQTATTLEATTLSSDNESSVSTSSSSSSGVLIGVMAAIGAIAAVVGAAAFHKRKQQQRQEAVDLESAITTPEGMNGRSAPRTPPINSSRHFFSTAF